MERVDPQSGVAIIKIGKAVATLPKSEQVGERVLREGDKIKVLVAGIRDLDNPENEQRRGGPKAMISRTSPELVKRLFEQEVPEIADGLISIKKIARIPGDHAKVAVESDDERIDPVGSCVGVKGSRIHSIVRELRNENIDVINYTSNLSLFISRALSPAKIVSITTDDVNKRAEVYIRPEDVSFAIGKGGTNIKLASKLTGYNIEVFRHVEGGATEEEDIYLDEFSDEIEQWVLDIFKENGYDTARRVLAASRDELIQKTDLEEETIDNVIAVLKAEFEE